MKLTLKQQVLGILALYLSVLTITLLLRTQMDNKERELEGKPLQWRALKKIESLETGSHQWIEDFELAYRQDYTLSRSSLEIESHGIELKNWEIVRKSDNTRVAKQIFTRDPGIQFSWLNETGIAYQGSGKETFSIYADISLSPDKDLTFLKFKQSPLAWHWLPKAYPGPWINVENFLTGKDMAGLQENIWHSVK